MKFENTKVFNFEGAIRGMRNPKNSHDRSDSYFNEDGSYHIGEADLKLMQTLIKAGSEHRKFMRQILICVDIIAPAYWFTELDTYKIGTTRNSSSFQHKGTSERFVKKRFEIDNEFKDDWIWDSVITRMNELRDSYLKTKDYKYFRWLRQLCPSSYLYRSTETLNYENIYNMYHQRKNHSLIEWNETFVSWVKTLPYAEELIIGTQDIVEGKQ